MAVFDSSAIIDIFAGGKRGEHVKEVAGSDGTSTTAICMHEVLIGLSAREREMANQFFDALEILPFDKKAAGLSVKIEEQLTNRGRPLQKTDLFIAAVCMGHGLPLITTDAGFKRVDGLNVIFVE